MTEKQIYPSYPKKLYPISKLKELEAPLNKRIAALIEAFEKMSTKTNGVQEEKIPAIENWFKESRFAKARKSVTSFFSRPAKNFVMGKFKNKVHQTMSEATIKWILKDLHKAGLLDESR